MSNPIEQAREAVSRMTEKWPRERIIASAVAEYNERMGSQPVDTCEEEAIRAAAREGHERECSCNSPDHWKRWIGDAEAYVHTYMDHMRPEPVTLMDADALPEGSAVLTEGTVYLRHEKGWLDAQGHVWLTPGWETLTVIHEGKQA